MDIYVPTISWELMDEQNVLDEQKQRLRREEVMNNQDLRDGRSRKKTMGSLSPETVSEWGM